MNQDQNNKLAMFKTTNGYLDNNASVWSAIPIVNTYKTNLLHSIEGIKEAALRQDASQVFIGASQRELKLQIAQKMDILDDTLEAYAADTENAELLSQAANSATDYNRLPNEEFQIKVTNVIDLLESNVDAMADYGMSTAQIIEVKATFVLFQDKTGTPRSYQIQSRIATGDLESHFEEATKVLSKLDNVMSRFKRSAPSFYSGYIAARKIIKN
jgi:hypothetical protein